LSGIHFLGVVHPGSAQGGPLTALKADFTRAANQVRTWIEQDAALLPADPGVTRDLAAPYAYTSDPVPHRDFPFGTTPRLGRGATSSNRKDDQRSIQLYSAGGKANAAGASLDYVDTCTDSPDGYEAKPGDIPVEPPRAEPRQYDPGPPTAFGPLLSGQQNGLPWPDFAAQGVTSHPSFGVGPIYRGRFASISVLILADPAEPNDLFTGRGTHRRIRPTTAGIPDRSRSHQEVPDPADRSGRHVRSECGQAGRTRRPAGSADPAPTSDCRTQGRQLGTGPRARGRARRGGGWLHPLSARTSDHPDEVVHRDRLTRRLAERSRPAVQQHVHQRHRSADVRLPTGRAQIPSADLPYGTPRWAGTSGTRGSRPIDRTTGKPSADYLKIYLPSWVNELPPPPLSADDAAIAALLT